VHRTYQTSNIRKGVIWSNTQQYSNPKVDDLMARAAIERDANTRKKLYAEFQKLVVEDCPIAYVFETGYAGAFGRNVGAQNFGVWGALAPLHEMGLKKA